MLSCFVSIDESRLKLIEMSTLSHGIITIPHRLNEDPGHLQLSKLQRILRKSDKAWLESWTFYALSMPKCLTNRIRTLTLQWQQIGKFKILTPDGDSMNSYFFYPVMSVSRDRNINKRKFGHSFATYWPMFLILMHYTVRPENFE